MLKDIYARLKFKVIVIEVMLSDYKYGINLGIKCKFNVLLIGCDKSLRCVVI